MNIAKERGLTRLRRGLTVFAGLLLLWWLAAQSGIPAFLLPTPSAWRRRCGTDALSRLAHAGHRFGDRQRAGAGRAARRGAGAVHDLLAAPATLADAAGAHQPGDTGVRPGAAAGAVVRLRHERQGGDGGAGDLLPGGVGLFDGLRRVNNDYLDLARTMRASRWRSCGTCG